MYLSDAYLDWLTQRNNMDLQINASQNMFRAGIQPIKLVRLKMA